MFQSYMLLTNNTIVGIMRTQDFIAVPDSRIQRDTEARAPKMRKILKEKFLPSQLDVQIAVLPDGERCKLNGHTRAFLWREGSIPTPEFVHVTEYKVNSYEEADELYRTFDNAKSVETAADKTYGAMRKLDIKFTSTYSRNNKFISTLKLISKNSMHKDQEAMLAFWLDELYALDELHANNKFFIYPLAAAFLITARLYGPNARDFWKRVVEHSGIKDARGYDVVEALSLYVKKRVAEKNWGGGSSCTQLAGIAIGAFLEWQRDPNQRLKKFEAVENMVGDLADMKQRVGM